MRHTDTMKEVAIVQPMMGIALPSDGLPSDLVDALIRLITDGPDDWGLGREAWQQLIPPQWRRWLSPGDEINRRLDAATAPIRDAVARARMRALDQLVGVPCLTAARAFELAGHRDAAQLLREFVTAEGLETRTFPFSSAFSLGFARSETTMPSTARALNKWKTRTGGLRAQGGTITGLSNTFVPLAPTIRVFPTPGPGVRLIGSPEAHVIGSYSYRGVLLGDDVAEWTATNELSLKSYFADNWTKRVNIQLVSNNERPMRYGNTRQLITWRTTLDGRVLVR